MPFSQTKSFPFAESFILYPQKPLVFATKTPLVRTTLYCPQKLPFYVKKPLFFSSLSLRVSKTAHFHKPKAFLSQKPFLLPPKATLFHSPSPIRTTLNLLFAKNTAVLLLFALILCCKAGASHRFKSLPAIPDEVAAFRKTGYLMIAGHFRKNTVSTGDLNRPRSPEVRKPLVCFLVLFAQRKKNKTVPFPGTSKVLQTSNQHTATAASHRNN